METLLIEVLADQTYENRISAKNKAKMRISRKNISRGSYSRTLSQARKNIRKAMFTLLLLGYIGLLQTPELFPFIETSNKIRSLVDLYTRYRSENLDEQREDVIEQISIVREEIKESLKNLIKIRRSN